jgi:hypothetical protein
MLLPSILLALPLAAALAAAPQDEAIPRQDQAPPPIPM